MRRAAGAVVCLVFGVVAARSYGPPRPWSTGDEVDLLEAVYRSLFDRVGWHGAGHYCVGTASHGKHLDPPPDLVARFARHRPPVVPLSACRIATRGHVRDANGEPAESFLVGPVRWIDARRAEVVARFRVHAEYGGAFSCTVARSEQGWDTDCYLIEMS